MAADVTIFAALFAGLVSFLSPCVLPLVPPYLVYLAGTSLERLAEAEPPPLVKRDTVIAAVLFVAGFSTVFVALGASASVIGALMRLYSNELAIIAGIAIIVMGLHFFGLTPIAFLHRQARIHVAKPVGLCCRRCRRGGGGCRACGRAVCRFPRALSCAPCSCRAGDGRPARAHRHRLSRRRVHAAQQLADRDLPGAAEPRLRG